MDSVKGPAKPVSRGALVLVLVAVVAALLPSASAHDDIESRASLTLQPNSGPPGTTVRADGANFISGTRVEIHLDSESGPILAETILLPGVTTFSISFQIPADASLGQHTMLACSVGQQAQVTYRCSTKGDHRSAVVPFTVTQAPAPSPSPTGQPTPDPSPGASPTPTETPRTETVNPTPSPTPTPAASPSSQDQSSSQDPVTAAPAPVAGNPTADFCDASAPVPPVNNVFDFEQEDLRTVTSLGDLEVDNYNFSPPYTTDPSVAARSGTRVLDSYASENSPLVFTARTNFMDVFRVFIGASEYSSAGQVNAVLTAFTLQVVDGRSQRVKVAQDSVGFAGSSHPFTDCLTVVAPGQIYEVILDYGDTRVEEMVDDVMYGSFGPPAPLPPDESPPQISIDHPTEGQLFRNGNPDGIHVAGTVTEDRLLTGGTIEYPGKPSSGLPLTKGAGGTYSFHLRLNRLEDREQPEEIRITATDMAGATSEATRRIDWNPLEGLDLVVVDQEVTQGIQCMVSPRPSKRLVRRQRGTATSRRVTRRINCPSNSVPVFERRPTLVRAYVSSNLENQAGGVTGTLCRASPQASSKSRAPILRPPPTPRESESGMRRAKSRSVPQCTSALDPIEVVKEQDVISDLRPDLSKTLNFMLPHSWVRGDRWLELTVNPGRRPRECDACFANNKTFFTVSFEQGNLLDLSMIPVKTRSAEATTEDIAVTLDTFSQIWPGRFRLVSPVSEEPLVADYDFEQRDEGAGCGDAWDALLADLALVDLFTDDSTEWLRRYGMVSRDEPSAYGGCGAMPGKEAAGLVGYSDRDADRAGFTMAQEVGHNHGRRHAPGCGVKSEDAGYPGTGTPRQGTTNEWGVDLRSMEIKPPSETFDFMGYCDPVWVGPYTYEAIHGAVGMVAAPRAGTGIGLRLASSMTLAQAPPPPEYLVGSFRLNENEATLTRGFYRVPLPPDHRRPFRTEGSYVLELKDAAGLTIGSQIFDPPATGDGERAGHAVVTIPWVAGTASITLSRQGVQLFQQSVSPGPPAVAVTSPRPGDVWRSGGQTISWTASDPDGDALTYSVQYSRDDGQSWSALGSGLKSTNLRLDAGKLGGGSKVRVRVWASDGVNTTLDEIDGPFAVAKKKPRAYITSPNPGQRYSSGRAVILAAAATDLEAGALPDGSYRWSSDKQGRLGQGPELWGLAIKDGKHKITLTVSDQDGQVSRRSVDIVVGQAGPSRKSVGLGAALLLALVTAAFLARILMGRRRMRSPSEP